MAMWALRTQLQPGRVVEPGDGYLRRVTCALDRDHLRLERDWAVTGCVEPPRPQRRLLDRADALAVAGTGSILLRDRVVAAMQAAGLTGWTTMPAPITLREGGLRQDMHELRATHVAGIAPPGPGMAGAWVCRGCGMRVLAPGLRLDLAAAALDEGAADVQVIWPAAARIYLSDRARRVLAGFDIEELDFVAIARLVARPPLVDGPPPPFWPPEAQARIAAFWRAVPAGPPEARA